MISNLPNQDAGADIVETDFYDGHTKTVILFKTADVYILILFTFSFLFGLMTKTFLV
jgi:hypothetical protein